MNTDWFFGLHIDPLSLSGKGMVLLLAVVLGGLIGLERQLHSNATRTRAHIAGMRTHILVCVGATVITLTSVEVGLGVRGGMRGDPGHIAAQIVSGIGFLGAGAILREGTGVRGLTTAASIWATAGIGIALGASPRLGELAVVATLVVLVTLVVLARVEARFQLKQFVYALEVEVLETEHGVARVLDLLSAHGIIVYGIQSKSTPRGSHEAGTETKRQLRMQVQLPRNFSRSDFNKLLIEEKGVLAFHLD